VKIGHENVVYDEINTSLDVTGNLSVSGDVGGATATITGNATVGGTLGVTGVLTGAVQAGEMSITGGSTATELVQNVMTQVSGWITGVANGVSFGASSTAAITAFADATGGQVTVTSAGHGLANGDIVNITGTTNYNGRFAVANVDTDTFEITDTWVADDATGTWVKGNSLTVAAAGTYKLDWAATYTAEAGAKAFTFSISVNNAQQTKTLRKVVSVGTGHENISGTGVLALSANDIVRLDVTGTTDGSNVTIVEGNINLSRLN